MTDQHNAHDTLLDTHISTDLQQHLQQLLDDLQLDDAPAGGAVVVYQTGKCIAKASTGLARPDTSWQPDTLAINFSTGKGVIATLAHVLVSEQLLDYDLPIAHYWPDFGCNGKDQVTLRQVMSHQADLFSIQSIDATSETILDWQIMLSQVAAMPVTTPEDATSYGSAYSALVYGWVLGGVVEAVTNMSFADALCRYLTEPLGIADSCYFGVPRSKVDHVAKLAKDFNKPVDAGLELRGKRQKPTLKADSQSTLQVYARLPSYACWQQIAGGASNKNNNTQNDHTQKSVAEKVEEGKSLTLNTAHINSLYLDTSQLNLKNYKFALIPNGNLPIDYYHRDTLQAVIPAANGVASAHALAIIYAMLANGGVWQGNTLINEETFAQLSAPQATGFDAVMPAQMQWRLGYHKLFNLCANKEGHTENADTGKVQITSGFGHMGYNGSVAWCDPARQLSFAYIHNFDTTMLNDIRQFALTEAVISLVDESH